MQMKLSEAMDLGRMLETPGNPAKFESCALGVAMAACGVRRDARHCNTVTALWPWIAQDDPSPIGGGEWKFCTTISCMYYAVFRGEIKFDDIITYVRSVEPPEPDELSTQPSTPAQRQARLPDGQVAGVLG